MQVNIRAVTVLLLTIFVAACTQAVKPATEVEPEAAASLLLFEPDHVDMGAVREGDDAVVYLRVRNSGDSMQQIADVQTSCGCSVAEPEERLIMPGNFTRIRVSIDTFAKLDDVRKWVLLTDAEGRTSKAWLTLTVRPNPHMGKTSRSIFDGKCGACHFEPASGKVKGPDIYAAVCSMCHGEGAMGGVAPAIAHIREKDVLASLIANGTGSQHMPGFATHAGGPLTDKQINALSDWLSKLDE
ncbi:Cytochrome C oxidase, cbb3-type, subunit III [Mariprofundus ferrinatatus]|uniref:Cytochrome C oxidase, cbb3-type, subunit III n=1 Tax=Mariprofundus ferrinatatus TaxID=1921087 RepID=A0A2K8L4H9_9PROT|nr:DUF1573 domain-containing protein [Mariprofundus ferrinatatus]ATX82230.1 Cytochrome C oxidase, cbb3-type, subunit III [Mariprofundus ferrinatatus]